MDGCHVQGRSHERRDVFGMHRCMVLDGVCFVESILAIGVVSWSWSAIASGGFSTFIVLYS
jgi:hypothetical protein